MSEKKLEEIMSKDKSLVRRVSDIEVEEVTLTRKGALGDEADAVILYKSDEEAELAESDEDLYLSKSDLWPEEDRFFDLFGEVELEKSEYEGKKVALRRPYRVQGKGHKFEVFVKDGGKVKKVSFGDPNMEIKRDDPEARKNFRSRHNCDSKTDPTTAGYWSCRMWSKDSVSKLTKESTEEAAKSVAELEKEEVAGDTTDGNTEMDFDSAISFIQKGELTDEQKQSVLDTALVMFDAADLEKEAAEPESSEVVDLLKQILEKVSPEEETPELEKELPEQFKKKKKKTEDGDSEEDDDKEDKKPEFLKKEEVSVMDTVEQLLRKSQEEKSAKERTATETAVLEKMAELSSVLSGLSAKFTESKRTLDRACGIDA